MRYRVVVDAHDGMMARVYVDRWRGADAAAMGAVRRDQYAGHQPRGVAEVTVTVTALCLRARCTRVRNHVGACVA